MFAEIQGGSQIFQKGLVSSTDEHGWGDFVAVVSSEFLVVSAAQVIGIRIVAVGMRMVLGLFFHE